MPRGPGRPRVPVSRLKSYLLPGTRVTDKTGRAVRARARARGTSISQQVRELVELGLRFKE